PITKSKLFNSIKQVISVDSELYEQFTQLHEEVIKLSDNEALVFLLEKQNTESNLKVKWAICLKISHIVRNHTSHNLDDEFLLFKDGANNKKIFLCILWSFFIVLYMKNEMYS
ncbi:hypothetical protein V7056_19580, partial [Bacillus sp. JJ664]